MAGSSEKNATNIESVATAYGIRRRPSSELGFDCRVRAQRDKHALRASGKCAGQHVGVGMGHVGVRREDVAAAIMRRHAGREGGG